MIKLVGIKLLRKFDLLSLVTLNDSLRAQTPFARPELGVFGVARTLSRSLLPVRRDTLSPSRMKSATSPSPRLPLASRRQATSPGRPRGNGDLNDFGFKMDALMLLKRSGTDSRFQ